MVRTPHFHSWNPGLIPGWGTKILQAMWQDRKKKNQKPTFGGFLSFVSKPHPSPGWCYYKQCCSDPEWDFLRFISKDGITDPQMCTYPFSLEYKWLDLFMINALADTRRFQFLLFFLSTSSGEDSGKIPHCKRICSSLMRVIIHPSNQTD